MTRRRTFTQAAEELRRLFPAWTWEEICAELGRRSAKARAARARPKPKSQASAQVFWWQRDDL